MKTDRECVGATAVGCEDVGVNVASILDEHAVGTIGYLPTGVYEFQLHKEFGYLFFFFLSLHRNFSILYNKKKFCNN